LIDFNFGHAWRMSWADGGGPRHQTANLAT
jgi:hypothetical protein